jgi:hypothetical protein
MRIIHRVRWYLAMKDVRILCFAPSKQGGKPGQSIRPAKLEDEWYARPVDEDDDDSVERTINRSSDDR